MKLSFSKILKAALLSAAFSFSAHAKTNIASFDSIKQKATELLLQKKKNQAIQLVVNYSKLDIGNPSRAEAGDFLAGMGRLFISKEAQEAYENSVNLTLENPKESGKSAEQCLALDPQQLECLIQKLRLQVRARGQRQAENVFAEIREVVPGSRPEAWLALLMARGEADFKNRLIFRNLPDKASEENFALAVLEVDRGFAAKNYSRVKDMLAWLEKRYPDWPDVLYYKYKLNLESAEEKAKANPEQLVLYMNKCKSLGRSVARKFRYDFELCNRGAE